MLSAQFQTAEAVKLILSSAISAQLGMYSMFGAKNANCTPLMRLQTANTIRKTGSIDICASSAKLDFKFPRTVYPASRYALLIVRTARILPFVQSVKEDIKFLTETVSSMFVRSLIAHFAMNKAAV